MVIAPAAGLADGSQRKEWHLPLQGVPPFHARSTVQCARLVVDGIAVSAVVHTPGVRGWRESTIHLSTCSSVLTEVECPFVGQTESECQRLIYIIQTALAVRPERAELGACLSVLPTDHTLGDLRCRMVWARHRRSTDLSHC